MDQWRSRKEFLRLSEEEEKALHAIKPLMARHVDELVDAFYRHLLAFAETRKLLSDELITTRLMHAQKRYLLSLVDGPYDEEYQQGRLTIGQVHERIGLTPQWYLGAYSLYFNLLRPLIFQELKDRPVQLQSVLTALTKVMFLDIQLAIEAYIGKSSERLEFANRQLATLSRELEKGLVRKGKDLDRERDFIATVLETSGALVLVMDREGRIVRFNPACEQTSGYAADEARGRCVWDFLLPSGEAEAVKAVFQEVRDGRPLKNYQNVWVRKDGEQRLIAWNSTCTTGGTGEVEHIIGTGIDITDLKRTREQLLHTERLAELATLASGMAHEIGTPMNVILGRAEFLMQRTKEENTRKGLETIVAQVERITKLMNQLLTFARRRQSERTPMDLRRTIEDSLEVLKERLSRHHITVESSMPPGALLVEADGDHISQVLLNLYINAIHAMKDGGTLRVVMEKVPDGQVSISVSDTGHGIPPQDVAKIFDPFFTTKEVGKGTGLGLTVAHGIIKEHGGSIHVESEVGRGTTFRIFLPACQP